MSRRPTALAERVRRLADALAGLRERVRAAVAAELGSAVGSAVRDLVRALAHGGDTATAPVIRRGDTERDWDDDPWGDGRGPPPTDRWDDESDDPAPPADASASRVRPRAVVVAWTHSLTPEGSSHVERHRQRAAAEAAVRPAGPAGRDHRLPGRRADRGRPGRRRRRVPGGPQGPA